MQIMYLRISVFPYKRTIFADLSSRKALKNYYETASSTKANGFQFEIAENYTLRQSTVL